MKTKKNVSLDAAELLNEIIHKGYEEAQRRVPQFTDRLFLWAHETGATDALSQFLAAFVDKAVTVTVASMNSEILKAAKDGKDTKK